MKKIIGLLLGITILTWLGSSQIVIENKSKPKNKNASRILEVEELIRITDESDEYFFKRPYSLSLDMYGFIYFRDGDFFLKFSPEGKFVKNLFRRGQGPGEVQSFSYNIQGDIINVYDSSKKIVFYGLDGQFIGEFKPEQHFGMRLVGSFGDSLIFSTYDMPNREERMGMTDIYHRIILISKDTGGVQEIRSFPIPWYVTANFGTSYAPFFVLPNKDGSLLFINDSPEYRIKVMKTATGEILRIFQRKYKRVKFPKQPPRPAGATQPKRKYIYDIYYMIRNEEQIWIWTSTEDKEKGVLFDVFSPDGEYLDSFYIPSEVSLMGVRGDILFARNQDEEGIYSVVKYKILNGQ
jgi:hypothetical protein